MSQDTENESKRSTWKEFMLEIFISVEGPNIFVIPFLFKEIGVFVGLLASMVVGLLYMNAMHSLVSCADEMSRRRNITRQSLYTLPQMVLEEVSCPRIGYYLKIYLKYEIIISWCLSLSLQWQFVRENLKLILTYSRFTLDEVSLLLYLLIPLILISWIPSFKYIDYLSYVVTFCIAGVTCVITYYLIMFPHEHSRADMFKPFDLPDLVTFMSYLFIMVSFTPLVFPLKNEMKDSHMIRHPFGPLTIVIIIMFVLNCAITVLVYEQIGNRVSENLFNNMPRNTVILITNCIFVILAIVSVSPSLLVIFMTIWKGPLEHFFGKFSHPKLYEYLVRSLISVIISLGLLLVPSVTSLINLITCFSFPFDSIFLPAILELALACTEKKKSYQFAYLCFKNIAVSIFAIAITVLSIYFVCIGDYTST